MLKRLHIKAEMILNGLWRHNQSCRRFRWSINKRNDITSKAMEQRTQQNEWRKLNSASLLPIWKIKEMTAMKNRREKSTAAEKLYNFNEIDGPKIEIVNPLKPESSYFYLQNPIIQNGFCPTAKNKSHWSKFSMQFTRQCDFNWMRAERIDLVSATWKSINVTHSCWAFAFIVVDLSRISVVLMIKLNFTFVLSSMLAVAIA